MKTMLFSSLKTRLILPLFLLGNFYGFSQSIPAESSKALVAQRVGLSDVTIDYARPNTKGRKIFGGLIPYHQIWRTGANYPTFITLTDTTFVEEKQNKLPPGKYALYTIPSPEKWTIIFSTNVKLWGAFGYKQKDDALRVEVKPDNKHAFNETFLINFAEVSEDKANINLRWENTSVSFRIFVDVNERVLNYIKEEIKKEKKESDAGVYSKGARFILNNKLDLNLALELINKAVEMGPDWDNTWVKARVHAAMGNYKEAIAAGEKAIEMGTAPEAAPYFPYASLYRIELENWKRASRKNQN